MWRAAQTHLQARTRLWPPASSARLYVPSQMRRLTLDVARPRTCPVRFALGSRRHTLGIGSETAPELSKGVARKAVGRRVQDAELRGRNALDRQGSGVSLSYPAHLTQRRWDTTAPTRLTVSCPPWAWGSTDPSSGLVQN